MAISFIDLDQQYARLKTVIDARIQAVLDHGAYIMGPEVGELEAKLAEFAGVEHCVAVSSGTDALLIALMSQGVGSGDAVFLPAFTYTATPEVILNVGATPVFVDVDAKAFNMDPKDFERKVTATRAAGRLRPRAVIPVDLFGRPADYERINAVAEEAGLFVLADAAQSFGGRLGGRAVGTLAHVTATSFFPAKPLGCYGDGGAIITDDGPSADVMRSIRLHGRGREKYNVVRVGVNGRLDTLQAAVLLAKLTVFDEELDRREAVARRYSAQLPEGLITPPLPRDRMSAWAQYTVQVDERDVIRAELDAAGIPSAVYYPRPVHLQPAFAAYGEGPGSMPVSENLCARVLSLPMHPYLGREDIDRICDAVASALRRAG